MPVFRLSAVFPVKRLFHPVSRRCSQRRLPAIIVVPMLHGFITSARMNGKARVAQRATTVAQDIMEGLKAYDIVELKEQFGDPMNGFYVIESKLIKGSIELSSRCPATPY